MVENKRPHSLAEIVQRTTNIDSFVVYMKEFIDYLIVITKDQHGTSPAIISIPADVFSEKPAFKDDLFIRTYMCALSEYLAFVSLQTPPDWCLEESPYKDNPFYMGKPSIKNHVFLSTPTPFIRRGLIVGEVLSKLKNILKANH